MNYRLLLIAAVSWAASAHAGVIINLEMKHKGSVSQLNIQVDGGSGRMEMTDAAGKPEDAVIRDGAKKRLLLISYKNKAYDEITEQQVKEMMSEMGQEMANLKAQLAALPPNQRAQVEAAMKQQAGMMKALAPEEKYIRASGTKRIAGYSCDLYSVEVDRKLVADTCLIPWSDLKVEGARLKDSLEVFQQGSMLGAKGSMKAWGTTIGFPAWRRTVASDGDEVTETTFISIRSGSVSKSAFEAPAGFKKRHDRVYWTRSDHGQVILEYWLPRSISR